MTVVQVRLRFLLEDTYKKLETLRTRVSDNHDGVQSHVSVHGHLEKMKSVVLE